MALSQVLSQERIPLISWIQSCRVLHSLVLSSLRFMPAFAGLFGVQREFAQFFGGTSLLILVGVVLDTLQQIESHLMMRHYDGLLETGRIRGPRSNGGAY